MHHLHHSKYKGFNIYTTARVRHRYIADGPAQPGDESAFEVTDGGVTSLYVELHPEPTLAKMRAAISSYVED